MRARGEQLVDLCEELALVDLARAAGGNLEQLVRLVERDEFNGAELDGLGAQDRDEAHRRRHKQVVAAQR